MNDTKKKHKIVSLSIVLVAAAFIAVLAIGLTIDQTKVPPAIIEKPANPFKVAWLQGQEHLGNPTDREFRLSDFRGKWVVLNFWASWCISCRDEARELETLWQQVKDDNIMVVGIAIQDQPSEAARFASHFGKTYIIGMDEDGKASIDYGVAGVPETFIIDPEGIIRHKVVGPVTAAQINAKLAPGS